MKLLLKKDREIVTEGLRLAVIHLQENPCDSSPLRKVQAALKVMIEPSPSDQRVDALVEALRSLLNNVIDPQGALLRPPISIVNNAREVLDRVAGG